MDQVLEVLRVEAVTALRSDAGTGLEAGPLEREFSVAHDYDTLDRDLEKMGMTLSRLPGEAGVTWRLSLPRGERVDAWEPGNEGLAPPAEIVELVGGVLAGKELVAGPPVSTDPGAVRLREVLEAQRVALLVHDPGTRLGDDPENLHQHRVAARRTRAVLRAGRRYLDPAWRRSLIVPLEQLAAATGPVRDLDVLLEHVRGEVEGLDKADGKAGQTLVSKLRLEREAARRGLAETLESEQYRLLLARLCPPPRLADGVDRLPLERIGRKEVRRLVETARKLSKSPDEDGIHRLRIALKRARYATELSAPDSKKSRRFLAAAKALQDLLGEHQDATVAKERLRDAAVVDAQTAMAFVAGRFAERQDERITRVHARLPKAWQRLRKRA
jgi:CHAD domain-containing protein